jgi:predicted LPLAT superfamily acyltransferase
VIESVEPPRQWQLRPEAGGRIAKWLLRPLAFGLGRPVARFICYFVAFYFMVRRSPERAASRVYLGRVLGRRAGWLDVYRHFLCFSRVVLDRLYLMTDQFSRFEVQIVGREAIADALESGRGALLLSAHLGSFDALRVVSLRNPSVSTRILLDVGQNAGLSELLNELNPKLAATISMRVGLVALVLEMQQALAGMPSCPRRPTGCGPGTGHRCGLSRAPAAFPASPGCLPAVDVPVVLAFGLYRGGRL